MLKICIVLVGAISTLVALISPNNLTISGLFILAADIVFVATLPQLICSLFIPVANGYGALVGKIFYCNTLIVTPLKPRITFHHQPDAKALYFFSEWWLIHAIFDVTSYAEQS